MKHLSKALLSAIIGLSVNVYAFDSSNLNKFAIAEELADYILQILPVGSTILELGSGSGTKELAKYYKMYSIEHNSKWVNKFDSTYIHAPIRNYGSYRWYDENYIKDSLPKKYDMILVDGPTGAIGRYGFYHHLYLFDTDVMIVFDDTHREAERGLFEVTAALLQRETIEIVAADGRKTSIITKK